MKFSEFALHILEKLIEAVLVAGLAEVWKKRRFLWRRLRALWRKAEPQRRAKPIRATLGRDAGVGGAEHAAISDWPAIAASFGYHLMSFVCVYFSLVMPPLVESLARFGHPVLLSHARLIGGYLPPIPIDYHMVQPAILVIALALYFPFLKIIEAVSTFSVNRLMIIFPEKSFSRIYAIRMLICVLFCIPLATGSVWCFTLQSLTKSFEAVVVFMVIMLVASNASTSEQRSRSR